MGSFFILKMPSSSGFAKAKPPSPPEKALA